MGGTINAKPEYCLAQWGTASFGAYVGLLPTQNVGVIVLTNEVNLGLPDAIGLWTLDRILGNPEVDHVAHQHKAAMSSFDAQTRQFAKPANAGPAKPVGALTGNFVNPAFGKASVALQGNAPVMTFERTGASQRLDPWDGGVFTATYIAAGRFAPVAPARSLRRSDLCSFRSTRTASRTWFD